MNIAILLTIFNRKETTLNCLAQLYKLFQPQNFNYTIFINDDGSTDGSYDAIINKYPEIKIYKSPGNLYWNRGMHHIWDIASKFYDYDGYLWLNDDTLLYESALNDLYKNIEQTNNQYILVGATNDKSDITSYSGYDLLENRITPNGKLQECCFFNGNFVFIPRKIFKTIGNLEFFYRHSFGDWDYGIRAFKKDQLKKSLINRLKFIYSPLGQNPNELFLFTLRKNGFIKAFKAYISIIFRTILKI